MRQKNFFKRMFRQEIFKEVEKPGTVDVGENDEFHFFYLKTLHRFMIFSIIEF